VSGAAAGETSIFHSISTQDPAWFYAIQPTVKVTVSATGQQGTNPHAELIAQMVEWRSGPQWVSYKAHTDRWDRALLAFGETVSDTSLTAMTAAEAQAFADRGWTRWVEVAAALTALEQAAQTPEPEHQNPPPANRAPTVSSALADATIVNASGTHSASLSGVFTDADGDSLTITAGSSNSAVATVSVFADHSRLAVTASSSGTATITVTADDGAGGTVSDAFTVTVKTAPVVASSPAVELNVGSARTVSLSGVFSDADGDPLTVTARSGNAAAAVVSVAAAGSALTIEGASAGEATITVVARDPDGNEAHAFFDVRVVLARAPEPASTPTSTPTATGRSTTTSTRRRPATTTRASSASSRCCRCERPTWPGCPPAGRGQR